MTRVNAPPRVVSNPRFPVMGNLGSGALVYTPKGGVSASDVQGGWVDGLFLLGLYQNGEGNQPPIHPERRDR